MSVPAAVVVPSMREEAVHALFRRSLAAVKRWFFFSWTPQVLVAERDGDQAGRRFSEHIPVRQQ